MHHIPTTATSVQKLNRRAKTRRKEAGISLASARDEIAKESGYHHWQHVSLCAERTAAEATALPPLPRVLRDALAAFEKSQPVSTESVSAFRSGLAFALDVKDADGLHPGDDVVECEDAKAIAAADIWRVLLQSSRDEASLATMLDQDELLEAAYEDVANYRLFRYTGDRTPDDLSAAFELVLGRYFFRPSYVWLSGNFIDIARVREVRVKGKVILSSAGTGENRVTMYSSFQASAEASRLSEPSLPTRRDLVCRLDIDKLEPGLYEARMSYAGQAMFSSAGFPTIRAAIENSAIGGDSIYAVEVAYGGLVVGTYPPGSLTSSAEMIAERAVSTRGSLGW